MTVILGTYEIFLRIGQYIRSDIYKYRGRVVTSTGLREADSTYLFFPSDSRLVETVKSPVIKLPSRTFLGWLYKLGRTGYNDENTVRVTEQTTIVCQALDLSKVNGAGHTEGLSGTDGKGSPTECISGLGYV